MFKSNLVNRVIIVTMFMALCSRESALAASYGSMGGSSSYGSSSSSSSSSSSYDYSSSLFESEPLSYSSNQSSTIINGTIICNCNCNCSKENQNKPLNRKFLCHKEKQVNNLIKAPSVYFWVLLALTAIALYGDEGRSGSVVMVQVGIADKDRVLQKRLNKIADSADTSTLDGLNYVLKEVVKALLKHYDSCHFAYFYDKYDRSMNNTMRPRFEQLLNREINRHDKDENTFVNVDGVKYKATVVDKANSTDNEYSVVTLLVLASEFQLNESLNRSIGNMKLLLQKLLFIQKNNIESVEVLWTPQREDETVLEQEICEDFPLLSIF